MSWVCASVPFSFYLKFNLFLFGSGYRRVKYVTRKILDKRYKICETNVNVVNCYIQKEPDTLGRFFRFRFARVKTDLSSPHPHPLPPPPPPPRHTHTHIPRPPPPMPTPSFLSPQQQPPIPPPSFSTDRSKAVYLLQCFLVCASVVTYVKFVLSLFVSHLSFFQCLRKAILCDCGIS